ncbi:lycopene beta-cyclase CrtY [Qipengyuania sp. JC766]|uniref:lycopene beta-cyclase CrtY n=1 Tax=Qipengyuania sp. JC766 TaxID=3232139 RepID=UPI003458EEA3
MQQADIAIVGGGLAGGLIALALRQRRPDCDVVLVEGEDALGGNHRWSWFESDLPDDERALLAPFTKVHWDGGYEVRFPAYSRTLASTYRSLASVDFDRCLRRELAQSAILTGRRVAALDAGGVDLADGSRIGARAVIDCRGAVPSAHLRGGWQVFMGRHLKTPGPHGLTKPVIMDATVSQPEAYRFLYVLPLSEDEVFLEDTYYQDLPILDRDALSQRLDEYAAAHGLSGGVVGEETGILPVITGGAFGEYQLEQAIPGVAMAGARGGFVHPLTSYTVPFAARTALFVAAHADLPGEELAARLADHAREHWSRTRFYRRLGAMLFGAARPRERYKVFQRFYRLDGSLIERFYAGRSTLLDRARILAGKPPVPVGRAISALAGAGDPLVSGKEKIG